MEQKVLLILRLSLPVWDSHSRVIIATVIRFLLWFLTACARLTQMTRVSVGTQASVLNGAMTQVAAGAQLIMVMVHGATINKVSSWKYEYSVKSTCCIYFSVDKKEFCLYVPFYICSSKLPQYAAKNITRYEQINQMSLKLLENDRIE